MANGTDSGSFYSKIKGFLPEVVGAGIGAALGGPAGAVSGAAGADEQEIRQQDIQAQRQQKMVELMQQAEEHRATLAQQHQNELDREADRQLQFAIERNHQQEQARHDKETEVEHKEHEQDYVQQQEANRVERTTLAAIAHGSDIGDDDYNSLIKNAGPGFGSFAGVKSPALRKVVAQQIIKSNGAASDSMVQQNLKIINDANGSDMDKTLAEYGSYTPNELNRLAHSIQQKNLKTPDQLKKEATSDTKESANLAKDLKTADGAFGKTFSGKLGIGGASARAHAIMQSLTGTTWSETTPTERASAERTLRQALTAKPDMSYEDMAQLLRPKGKPPASASSGGVKKVSAGGLPAGLPQGTKDNGDGTYTTPAGHIVRPIGG